MTDVRLRSPRPDEKATLAELINSVGQALLGENLVSEEDVEAWYTSPAIDPDRDLLVAEETDGGLVGAGSLVDAAEDHAIIWLRVVLHPARAPEGLGEQLLAPLEQRARELGTDRSLLHAGCLSAETELRALYERSGYELVRHFFRMQVDLGGELPEPEWPEGLELRPFDPDEHFALVHAADEEAFEDHWGSVHTSLEEWRHFMTAAHYDPALWYVVWDGNEIAGFSLCNANWTGDQGLGWVNVLGVRRPWRRRGLALALLVHSFRELEQRGMNRVALGVDAENLTGALRLYEKAGMRVVRQSDTWQKPLSAVGA